MNVPKMRKVGSSKDDAGWNLLCSLLPGTVLKLSGFGLLVFTFYITKKYFQRTFSLIKLMWEFSEIIQCFISLDCFKKLVYDYVHYEVVSSI